MREDVKDKHFSTTLRETSIGARIQAPSEDRECDRLREVARPDRCSKLRSGTLPFAGIWIVR
jgi:hypothetical protein